MPPTTKRGTGQQDPLDALVAGPIENVIALMLWKNRHRNPDMNVVIKEPDIQALKDCCAFHKVVPKVVVVRPGGQPATPAIPARGNRPGRPAMPAEPGRPHVVVALVAKGSMDAVKPLDNNEDDAALLHQENERRRWKGKAGVLAVQAMQMSSGDVSTATLQEIASCLQAFAQEE